MGPVLRRACAVFVLGLLAAPAAATDYYVSADGNDAGPGTSAAPWRTLAQASVARLAPGDRVLLRGGDVFRGTLSLDGSDGGTPDAPVVISSYGSGRATIDAGDQPGVFVYNTSGVAISNLVVTGSGGTSSGVTIYTDLPGGVKLPFVRIDDVDASGFGSHGVTVGSWNGATGYRDVRITRVVAHDNVRGGIGVFAQVPSVHEQVYVGQSQAFNNSGDPDATTNSGSGIVLGGVNGGIIERSVAHDNGYLCTAPDGPVGIWTYDSSKVVIQYNESYRNRSLGGTDGDGFDLDQNVSGSALQYNYSHENDGAGYLLVHGPATDAHTGNVVRFNISENDGRRNGSGAIEVWGRVRNADISNNTVYMVAAAAGMPSGVRVWNAGVEGRYVSAVHFRNNVFVTGVGVPLVTVTTAELAGAQNLRFEGNDYFSPGAQVFAWGAMLYTSLDAWRATTQEMVAGRAVGVSVDPDFMDAGNGGTVGSGGRVETLVAYRLAPGSPLATARVGACDVTMCMPRAPAAPTGLRIIKAGG